MKIIGITGNSGSGKSTISKLISKNYEAKIIDADKIAKEMTKNNGEYLQAIRQAFGNDVIKNNELDRYRFGISVGKKIGNAVCRNKFKRQIRNIVDKNKKYYQNNMDYIIILRKASLEVEFDTLKRSFENLIAKINQGDKNEKKS